jgi:hypothetical protein
MVALGRQPPICLATVKSQGGAAIGRGCLKQFLVKGPGNEKPRLEDGAFLVYRAKGVTRWSDVTIANTGLQEPFRNVKPV